MTECFADDGTYSRPDPQNCVSRVYRRLHPNGRSLFLLLLRFLCGRSDRCRPQPPLVRSCAATQTLRSATMATMVGATGHRYRPRCDACGRQSSTRRRSHAPWQLDFDRLATNDLRDGIASPQVDHQRHYRRWSGAADVARRSATTSRPFARVGSPSATSARPHPSGPRSGSRSGSPADRPTACPRSCPQGGNKGSIRDHPHRSGRSDTAS